MSSLVLGPLLRYVDQVSATIWVETSHAATVRVVAGEQQASAPTFAAHGHHYALVELDGLTPGTRTPYTVLIDDTTVWPEPSWPFPPSVIPTLDDTPLRLAFGSCRVSVPHDEEGTETFGVDALRAYALHMAAHDPEGDGPDDWPDLVLFLGDQVYADEISDQMREFIASRRGLDAPPGAELKDYEEYAHLYSIAWGDPANRWLLSTLPSAMIFDDHDIRDDWNTSWKWRREMEATSWWHDRIVGGLASYWVYQHLGNLGADERAADTMWQQICAHDGPDELDVTAELDELAEQADQRPDCYRWSFSRDFGTQARLIVVDSRAARVLEPEQRSILDPAEMEWLDELMVGGFDHILIGTSLPFLMAPALHHVEAFSEGLCDGAWGRVGARIGERLRQAVDLEHWAAFQQGFRRVAGMTIDVASGARGAAPHTVVFLSGDVHHSYLGSAWPDPAVSDAHVQGRILQAVCSPIRNPLPPAMQRVMRAGTRKSLGRVFRRLAKLAKVPASPLKWQIDRGPWVDNNLAVLEVRPGGGLCLRWWGGDVEGRASDDPVLRVVAEIEVPVSESAPRPA